MKPMNHSISTILQDMEQNIKLKKKGKLKKKAELPPSVIVFQHNNLIEAKYSLTLQEKRIILWLTSQIQPNDKDFKNHTLKVRDFMDLVGLTGNANYTELRKITFGLMKKVLVIKEPELKVITQVAWLNYARYEEGTGVIELGFSDKMRPFLLSLKKTFTAISLSDLMQFSSIHAIRIYELLKQYQEIGTRVLTIDEIRQCCGVVDKLKEYISFKNKVLLIAQREINEKSDIMFEFEPIKHVRKIVAIKFLIKKNRAYELNHNPMKEVQAVNRRPSTLMLLKDFGLSTRIINKIIREHTEQTIEDAVRAVDIQLSRGQVRNTKAMLITAIKERWHPDRYKKRD